MNSHKTFFPPDVTLPQGELSVKMAQLLGLWGPWWCQVHRDMDCLQGKSYGHQSFSISPPVQALRGLPCLGFFCCSVCQVHRGTPMAGVLFCRSAHQALKVGSYSVVQCARCLMGQLSIVQLQVLACGERGYGDGSTPYT